MISKLHSDETMSKQNQKTSERVNGKIFNVILKNNRKAPEKIGSWKLAQALEDCMPRTKSIIRTFQLQRQNLECEKNEKKMKKRGTKEHIRITTH